MTYSLSDLNRRLQSFAGEYGVPERYVVAFSGGMDSAVLLHSLAAVSPRQPVLALHVDHGLHPESTEWSNRACAFAKSLGVTFEAVRATVDRSGSRGLEAAAREARYRVFEERIGSADWLLSAHHRDDQGETLLLNLLRGSGPLGLAGMPAARPLGKGLLVRPLLEVTRDDLFAYAKEASLAWVDDPANADLRFDRNFLRHSVLPLLAERWPDISARLAKSAAVSAEAQHLLDVLASSDLDDVAIPPGDRLSIPRLRRLDLPRQRNLLRHVCRIRSLPLPPSARLEAALVDVTGAAADAQPLVTWDGAEIRRYRDALFVSGSLPDRPAWDGLRCAPGAGADLGPGLGRLELEPVTGPGMRRAVAESGLSVALRRGGERLRISPAGATRSLKNLMQERGILPWMRDRLPLLYSGDELVAVADLWVNAECLGEDGFRVVWHERPVIC